MPSPGRTKPGRGRPRSALGHKPCVPTRLPACNRLTPLPRSPTALLCTIRTGFPAARLWPGARSRLPPTRRVFTSHGRIAGVARPYIYAFACMSLTAVAIGNSALVVRSGYAPCRLRAALLWMQYPALGVQITRDMGGALAQRPALGRCLVVASSAPADQRRRLRSGAAVVGRRASGGGCRIRAFVIDSPDVRPGEVSRGQACDAPVMRCSCPGRGRAGSGRWLDRRQRARRRPVAAVRGEGLAISCPWGWRISNGTAGPRSSCRLRPASGDPSVIASSSSPRPGWPAP